MQQASAYPWDVSGDLVVFETPEQTQVEYRLAPFGTRVVAAFFDWILLLVASSLIVIGGFLVLSEAATRRSASNVFDFIAVVMVVHSILWILYATWAEVVFQGQTLGKRITGIRTIMTTGQGVTLGAAIVRNCARLIEVLPLLWLIPTTSKGCQRIGDLLGGTYVVVAAQYVAEPAQVDWPADAYADLEEKLVYLGGELAGKLYPDDLNLIEYMLVRVQQAPPRNRPKLLRHIALRYIARLGLEEHEDKIVGEPRRFFHELGLFLKSRFEGQAY